MMEAIWIILPVGYILGMIALAFFSSGGGQQSTRRMVTLSCPHQYQT